ncbi:C-factor-like [Oppia nitens]|uniref:C-factor-like n=1 Tax=Oppia nitens TaxID=1686743 RepID=UPI0023DABD5B|nr:C-factor-like [Oppia nitens]
MSLQSVIITGANRGIGLEFVRQLLATQSPPKHLIVTSRQSANPELDQLVSTNPDRLHVLKLEVKDYDSYDGFVQKVATIVGSDGLDTLVNNAGILIYSNLQKVTAEDMLKNFEINSVTPLMLTKALLPLLKSASANRKTAVVNISSKVGSVEDNTSGGGYPYRSSKSALNMITKSLAIDLKADNIRAIALHPGWVQTDMGGPNALITTGESVSKMLDTIRAINDKTLGDFLNYDGKPIPL